MTYFSEWDSVQLHALESTDATTGQRNAACVPSLVATRSTQVDTDPMPTLLQETGSRLNQEKGKPLGSEH